MTQKFKKKTTNRGKTPSTLKTVKAVKTHNLSDKPH